MVIRLLFAILVLSCTSLQSCTDSTGNKAANENATSGNTAREISREMTDSSLYTGAHLEDAPDNTNGNADPGSNNRIDHQPADSTKH